MDTIPKIEWDHLAISVVVRDVANVRDKLSDLLVFEVCRKHHLSK